MPQESVVGDPARHRSSWRLHCSVLGSADACRASSSGLGGTIGWRLLVNVTHDSKQESFCIHGLILPETPAEVGLSN